MEVALWCLVVLALWAGLVFLVTRKRTQDREAAEPTLERTEEHEALIIALRLWLTDFKIARTIIDQRLADARSMDDTLNELELVPLVGLKSIAAYLLSNRIVRLAVARYECKRMPGITHGEAMSALLDAAQFDLPGRTAAHEMMPGGLLALAHRQMAES